MSTFNTLAARRLEIARHTSMGVSRMPKGDYETFSPAIGSGGMLTIAIVRSSASGR